MTNATNSSAATPSPVTGTATTSRTRFWRWVRHFLFLGLLAGGLLIYFLPSLVARYVIRGEAAAWVTANLSARIEIGDASLGWQSPVLLHDVIVRGDDGRQIAAVSSITSRQSLWELLTDSAKPFEFELEGIRTAFIVKDLDPHRERLAMAQFIDQFMKLAVPQPQRAMTVTIVNGQFDLKDQAGNLLSSWAPIAAKYQYVKSPSPRQTVTLHAPVATTTEPGEVAIEASWQPDPRKAGAEVLRLDAGWRQQPMAAIQPWIANFLDEEALPESLSGKLDLVVNRDRDRTLALSADAVLGPPEESLTQVSLQEESPTVRIHLQTDFSRPNDTLTIPKFQAEGADLVLDARGEITDVSRTETVDIAGQLHSPGEILLQFLPEHLRDEVDIQNVRITEFSIKGPLRKTPDGTGLPPLAFTTTIGWDSIQAYQFLSDDGLLRVTLDGNRLDLEPLRMPVNGGHVRQLPTLHLHDDVLRASFEAGSVLDGISLNERMCRGWLKYVSPTLANATAAEGRFSLVVQGGEFPVTDVGQGRLEGTLTVHSARVGPGPLAGQILAVTGQIREMLGRRPAGNGRENWLTIQQQDVHFRVADGRVAHDHFAFTAGEMRVSTRGSVGLEDDSLDLVLSLQIPDSWLADAGPVLRTFKGETIDLAVRGTVDEPRIDAAPLADFARRAGLKAAGGLLQQLLERRLNRDR